MSAFQSRVLSGRPSVAQVRALLDELEGNPYLAQGKLRKRSTPLWNSITKRLNLLKGCKKCPKQWMKYWSDKKVAVKRMLEAARVASENNGPDLVSLFTDIEHRVIAILENPILVETETDFPVPDSLCMEAEYLDNVDFISDCDQSDINLENPLIDTIVDSKIFQVKLEPNTMKQSLRSSTSQKRKKGKVTKTQTRPMSYPQMWQKLLHMEERRVAAQESISNTLSEIETSMRRQEEATRELARVLLRLLR